jgi:hypothetical protein
MGSRSKVVRFRVGIRETAAARYRCGPSSGRVRETSANPGFRNNRRKGTWSHE